MLAALYILGSLVAAWLGGLALVPAGELQLPAVWFPAGMLFGIAVVDRTSRLPLWAAVSFIAMILSVTLRGVPVSLAIVLGAVVTATVCGGALAVRRRLHDRFNLGHFTDALTLIVGILGAAVAAAVLSVAVVGLSGARAVFLADAIGMLLAGPLVAGLITERRWWRDTLRSWRLLEVVIVFAGALLITDAVFGERVEPFLRVPAFILPFMLWPAFRFGPSGSALVIAVICTDAFQNLSSMRSEEHTSELQSH